MNSSDRFYYRLFQRNYGWARWLISISKLLTWKCKPHFRICTWNFSSTFATIGDDGGAESSSRVAVKCGVGGAKYQFPISNQLTLIFHVGNYVNNFWCKPNITSLRVGDMASTSGHGGLRSSSSFCSWSSGLTSPLGDLRPSFDKFKMAYHVEN